ncbi:MAG: hypothetical protein DA328_08120 [Nitrososphaeraceae archaeon]|nr:hypothetical protein [Nitrososphaeraceae archaeon]
MKNNKNLLPLYFNSLRFIVAGPGSGKTLVIVKRIIHFVNNEILKLLC